MPAYNGEAYLPLEECEDSQGRKYTRYVPCPVCEGSGNQPGWISSPGLGPYAVTTIR